MVGKKIIWIVVAILAVLTVSAVTTNDPKPLIKINYNETVIIINISLMNTETLNYTDLNLLQNISNMNFTYQPVSNLDEGDYLTTVLASDIWGNEKTTSLTFTVDLTLIVELIEPTYGVSPTTVFDIVFETSVDSICKYDYTFPKAFVAFRNMDITGSKTHGLNNFNWSDSEYVANGRKFFVACNTTVGVVFGENGEYEFILSVDETAPLIERLEAVPNPVAEYILIDGSPRLITRLELDTDEDTICKYSETITDYDSMENNFPDLNAYKRSHHVNLTFPTEIDYNYKVACENLAGLISTTENITITVDTSIGIVITSVSPSGYLSANTVTLEATTNKLADCNFINSSGASVGTTTNTKTHTKTLTLSGGEHNFVVECTKVGVTTSETIDFIIDSSEPINVVVDDTSIYDNTPQFTKDSDKLRVMFSAEDPESGIREYKFRLEDSSGEIIKDWETGEEDVWIEVTNLALANDTYKFRVNVTNNAGLSSTALSDGINVDTTLIVIIDPTCNDSIKNQGETDIDCGGPCNSCSIGKECSRSSDCSSDYCSINNTCQQPLCGNNYKDTGETDIDCGGICVTENKTCDLGQDCNVGADCTTGYCNSNNICIKDPDDIDEDGIVNEEDNDRDGDGTVNWEDPDDDEDGKCDTAGSPLNVGCTGNDNDDDNDGIPDPDDKDTNNDVDDDGIENELDNDIDGDEILNNEDPDDDNDGLCDTYDSPLNDPAVCAGQDDDDDNDGIPDWQEVDNDNDLDNDGIDNERDDDMDGDSILNEQDPDDDNDGLCDTSDSPLNDPAVCTGEDDDDDNDGIDDLEEDNDNDGIPDWWEIEHGLNPLVPDSSEIRTETGLSYYEEYIKELEAEREREGIPSDVLEEEGTSFLTILILMLAIIAVLGTGGYYGYTAFQKKKGAELRRMPGVIPGEAPKMPQRIPKKPPIRKEVSEEIKKRIEERIKKRREKRKSLFETFGEKKVEKKKGPVKLVMKKTEKEKKKEKPEKEWVTLEELKKKKGGEKEEIVEKLSGFIKSKDLIDEIKKSSKKDVFAELEKITGEKGKKEKKVFGELEEITGKSKKEAFDELDKLEKKLAKEKKNVGKK